MMCSRAAFHWQTLSLSLAFAAATLLAQFSEARAADFKGQTLTIAIASGTGGGYDAYGRLAARHLPKHLAGNPAVVPKNMPGAGGVVTANWLYNVAPKDGTAMAIFQAGTAFEPLFGNRQAKFDPTKFNWLISLNRLANIGIFWHDSPVHTVDDLFKGEVLVGSSGGGNASTQVFPVLLNNLIGTKFKVIAGYSGTGETGIAMERGEVHGIVGTEWSSLKASRPDWIRDKKVRVVIQISLAPHPELKDVPSVINLIKDNDSRQVMELLLARQEYGRPFAAPPGAPADVITALRAGFARMAEDKDFLADANKLRAEIDTGTPEQILALLNKTYGAPKPLVERAVHEFQRAGGG
jgi:tripartite-type tricarboxylate transporter receptor subunit TctC